MIRFHTVSIPALRAFTLSSAVVAVASLAGCNAFSGLLPESEKVDYHTGARQTTGLDVPPELTQLAPNGEPRRGSISAAALQNQANAAPQTAAPSTAQVALNSAGKARIERQGEQRWIHSDEGADKVWPLVRSFWIDQGFEIATEQAETGVLETNWLENRAKLPQDFIRRTIGSVLDGLYSTGERDKYRVRIERATAGGTDIFITHRGMIEVYTTGQRDGTAWQPRPADTSLEAEMSTRLMLRLGGVELKAATVAAAPSKADAKPTAPTAVAPSFANVPDSLSLAEGFDSAWRRVGQSLDRHGFTLEDRDRSQGLFFLRYADPNTVGKEEANFFAKLFGAKDATSTKLRVSVKSEGDRSTIMVLDDKNKQTTNELAKRILGLLQQDLK